MITSKSLVHKSKLQTSGELNGETMLMQLENGNYYGLGTTGSDIWNLIDSPIQVITICEELSKKYEVNNETCLQDVLKFLNQLESENLIECQ